MRQLEAYFAGELLKFDLPLELQVRSFNSACGGAADDSVRRNPQLQRIARSIGAPAAVRAVGAANGRNPIPIIVPCHRVIGSSGNLVGYGGGLPMKRMLLDLEAEHYVERLRKATAR